MNAIQEFADAVRALGASMACRPNVVVANPVVVSDSLSRRCGCNAPVRATFLRAFTVVECRVCGASWIWGRP